MKGEGEMRRRADQAAVATMPRAVDSAVALDGAVDGGEVGASLGREACAPEREEFPVGAAIRSAGYSPAWMDDETAVALGADCLADADVESDRLGLLERPSPSTGSISASHAPVLPDWALFLAVDDDGAVFAFARRPQWLGPQQGWCPLTVSDSTRVDADSLDWRRLAPHRVTDAPGNGRLYVLPEPAANFVKRPGPSRRRRIGALWRLAGWLAAGALILWLYHR
jgi:hypothetical protein